MTHEELRKAAFACLRREQSSWNRKSKDLGFGCSLVVSELVTAAFEIPDAIGWHYGQSILIECKCSRADFFADAKKPHRLRGSGAGNQRYFLTPPDLLKTDELPFNWGLLELHGREVRKAYSPDWNARKIDQAGHISEKRILLSLVARIKAREFLFISSDRVDAELCESDGDSPLHA